MSIQDGYGDQIDIEMYLANNERLLKLKAGERLRGRDVSSDIWDDVLQEGRIVQWEVLKRQPDAEGRYVSGAMSLRMNEVISRGTWTGMSRTHGHPTDPLRRRDRDSVDDETIYLDQVVDSSDWVDRIEMAYHDGEIGEALASLTFTQRQHCVGRIWYGMTEPEIAAMQGCSVATVSRHWTKEIKPHLAGRLAQLASAV